MTTRKATFKGDFKMILRKENETLVYTGGTWEELGWGAVQFPKLYPMKNGNIGLSVHDDDDTWEALIGDSAEKWFVTEDKGGSWRSAEKHEVAMMGTQLPNGDVLRPQPEAPVKLEGIEFEETPISGNYHMHVPSDDLTPKMSDDPTRLPEAITAYSDIFGRRYTVFWLDTLPDNLIEKRLLFKRLKNGEIEAKPVHVPVEWKHRTTYVYNHEGGLTANGQMLENAGLFACRDVVVAPDGSLLIPHYRPDGANPYTGVFEGHCTVYFLRSTDNGESWKLHGYIPYEPDDTKDIHAHLVGGFSEPCITFEEDGSMLCILRSNDAFYGAPSWGPIYLTRSYDGGKTWEKPQYFKDRGALPQLLHLKNGITLAVVTRPGIYVYASKDGGRTWSEPLEIMTDKDRTHLGNTKPEKPHFHRWVGSCCNCTILPIADNRALLSFSDFYVPDENGVKRKGIKTIEIIAE